MNHDRIEIVDSRGFRTDAGAKPERPEPRPDLVSRTAKLFHRLFIKPHTFEDDSLSRMRRLMDPSTLGELALKWMTIAWKGTGLSAFSRFLANELRVLRGEFKERKIQ